MEEKMLGVKRPRLKIVLIVSGFVVAVVGIAYVLLSSAYLIDLTANETVWDRIDKIKRVGSYELCDELKDYREVCIVETELQQKMIVEYDCDDNKSCNGPACVIDYHNLGPEVGFLEYCTVDQAWVCMASGGEISPALNKDQLEAQRISGGAELCVCPPTQAFIDGYGCVSCDTFENEETRLFCNNTEQQTWRGAEFKKAY